MKHRLLYEEMKQLSRLYEVDQITCGYIRDYSYDEQTRLIEGVCSLTKKKCVRQIPMQLEFCVTYTEFLKKRRKGKC